ncbi:hypothetical protein B9Z19DRAFT_1131888 [Tuber borchii]|uniref:Uncharacterized protein n=1 Tax=Tuber borchii TaxID=42251 RepID=A0A2T6ZI10_TUBBO|nr:hypothetical protein B9Z19DRAFT_1131888 [Tuber borchii]
MASLPPSAPYLWLEYDGILPDSSSSSSCNSPSALYHPTQVSSYEAQVLSDSGGPLIVFGSEGESKELASLNSFDGQGILMSPDLAAYSWGMISGERITDNGSIDNFQSQATQNNQRASNYTAAVGDLDTSFHNLLDLSHKLPYNLPEQWISSSHRRGGQQPQIRKDQDLKRLHQTISESPSPVNEAVEKALFGIPIGFDTIRLLLFITLRKSGNAIFARPGSIDVTTVTITWPTNRKAVKGFKRKGDGVNRARTSSQLPGLTPGSLESLIPSLN